MKNYNDQIANTILQSQLEQNKLSHAYLFIGDHEQYDFAVYAAQAILCDAKKIGACGTCSSCQRVAENQHADFIHINNGSQSIKKEDVLKLQTRFQQSSLEESGHQVYIIDDVENASLSAMNSLLKFLEEPQGQITAILTSSNEQRVLETIKSRCLVIPLKESPSEHLFNELIQEEYDLLDAYYLSHLFPSLQAIEARKQYHHVADVTKEFINDIEGKQLNLALVKLQSQITKQRKMDREDFILFLDMLSLTYNVTPHDIIAEKLPSPNVNAIKFLEIVIKTKDRIRPGVNLGLVVDQFAYALHQEKIYD